MEWWTIMKEKFSRIEYYERERLKMLDVVRLVEEKEKIDQLALVMYRTA